MSLFQRIRLTFRLSSSNNYIHDVSFPGYPLTKISAVVADVFEAGTNSAIYLRLKNSDTGENCETLELDVKLNNWVRGGREVFTDSSLLAPCRLFYPSQTGRLMFNFREDFTLVNLYTSNDLILTRVTLHFGPNLQFTWHGWQTFNYEKSNSWLAIK